MHDVSCWQASVRLLTVAPFCWIGKERWWWTRSHDETLQCAKRSGRFFKVLQCATNFQKVLQDDAVVSNSNKFLQSSVKVLQKSTRYVACPGPDQGREGSRRYWIRWWQILSDLRHFWRKEKSTLPSLEKIFVITLRQLGDNTTWRQLGGN